jgi:hypothetical protein
MTDADEATLLSVSELRAEMAAQFESLRAGFDGIDKDLDALSGRLDEIVETYRSRGVPMTLEEIPTYENWKATRIQRRLDPEPKHEQ